MNWPLSEVEKRTLQQMSVNHQHRDIRTRAAGLLLGNGLSAPKAAAALDVSAQSIYNWSRLRNERGLCRLLSGHGGGRPRALPEAMLATAMEGCVFFQREAVSLKGRNHCAEGRPTGSPVRMASACHA